MTVDKVKAPERHACVAGPFGSSISSKFFVEKGVPVIRGSNLSLGLERFISSNFVFIAPETAEKFSAQTVVPGDLVFTCWGTIGQVGLIPPDGPFHRYVISNKQLKLRVDSQLLEPLFAYYYFACPETVEYIQGRAIGSAVPGINLGILKSLPVILPPIETQRRIASILGAYDDLIEVNRRRIAVLGEMARRLFDEWFVNFRFPGHEGHAMVETKGGTIPEGWTMQPLEALTSYISRGIAPAYDDEAPGLVINQKCIRDGRLSLKAARRQRKAVPPVKVVEAGDILVNSTGTGTLGRIAQAEEIPPGTTVDSHVTIIRPRREVDRDFLGTSVSRLQALFESMAVGATNQMELNRSRLASTEVVVPHGGLAVQFGAVVRPIRVLAHKLERQCDRLTASRDLLLPRLISGELSVATAERELEDAA
ncbi:restriction endonuclease subunit S [Acidocella facilis]|uniref:restriction endonuclease subunit S n=1 Tax=Acidocella facilis TaxID=525 RepID=UPI0009DDD86E|nr:restriction endonuclease subunit S [Acidocella facilis]